MFLIKTDTTITMVKSKKSKSNIYNKIGDKVEEFSSCSKKSICEFFRLKHRQLQRLYRTGLLGESCPPYHRLNTGHRGHWRELQLRTQAPWPAILSCISAFPDQIFPFSSLFIWALSQRPSSGLLQRSPYQERGKTFWRNFLCSDSVLSIFPLLALALCLLPAPGSIKWQTHFVQSSVINKMTLKSVLIHLNLNYHTNPWGKWIGRGWHCFPLFCF